jgi:fructose-bisphosphate aldolase class II
VRKVNIDTDCRMAMTGQIRKVLMEDPGEFDPRKYLKPAMAALTKLCRQRFEEFRASGNASDIQALPISEMAKRYRSGNLDPKFG